MPRKRRWLVLFVIVQATAVVGAAYSIGHEWDFSQVVWRGLRTNDPTFVHHHRGYPIPWDGWVEVVDQDGNGALPPPWAERIPQGNVTYPFLIALLTVTGPWVAVRPLLRVPAGRVSRWARVVCLASAGALACTAVDMISGRCECGHGFARSQVGRFCLQNRTVSEVIEFFVDQRRPHYLHGMITEDRERYCFVQRMLLTDAATRAGLAFLVGLAGSALVYRPWRRPPHDLPPSTPPEEVGPPRS